MQLAIEARQFKARDELIAYTEREVKRLDKVYDRIIDVQVILEGKLNKKEAMVKVNVYGQTLVASDTADKFEVAVEAAVDKLELQLKRYKEKLQKR